MCREGPTDIFYKVQGSVYFRIQRLHSFCSTHLTLGSMYFMVVECVLSIYGALGLNLSTNKTKQKKPTHQIKLLNSAVVAGSNTDHTHANAWWSYVPIELQKQQPKYSPGYMCCWKRPICLSSVQRERGFLMWAKVSPLKLWKELTGSEMDIQQI